MLTAYLKSSADCWNAKFQTTRHFSGQVEGTGIVSARQWEICTSIPSQSDIHQAAVPERGWGLPWDRPETPNRTEIWGEQGTPVSPPLKLCQLIRKDLDAGKDWGQKENGVAEDGMVGWHHRLNGHEFEQTWGDSEGQKSLACCTPWGHRESDMT